MTSQKDTRTGMMSQKRYKNRYDVTEKDTRTGMTSQKDTRTGKTSQKRYKTGKQGTFTNDVTQLGKGVPTLV